MELIVLNSNFEPFDILDSFESLIWVDRYCECGEFELCSKASEKLLRIASHGNYLQLKGSQRLMAIEDVKDDIGMNEVLTITGRSIEAILNRRIVWQQTILSGSLQDGILKLLDENVINPSIADRAIPNFIFEASIDPIITSLTIDSQIIWDNLYDSIQKLCETNNLGFMITLSNENELIFKLYSGIDRTYDQVSNPYVVFSPNFDNLLNSGYTTSTKQYKNVTLVAGEGEGIDRMTTIVGGGQGIDRREMYTDASDISQDTSEALLSDSEYLAQLAQRGNEDLVVNSFAKTFEGKLGTFGVFTYGDDFFLGDLVQIVTKYGLKAKARILELVQSQDTSGKEIYPTFTLVE